MLCHHMMLATIIIIIIIKIFDWIHITRTGRKWLAKQNKIKKRENTLTRLTKIPTKIEFQYVYSIHIWSNYDDELSIYMHVHNPFFSFGSVIHSNTNRIHTMRPTSQTLCSGYWIVYIFDKSLQYASDGWDHRVISLRICSYILVQNCAQ